MRNCVFLLADDNMKATFEGFLSRKRFHFSLNCGAFDFDATKDLAVASDKEVLKMLALTTPLEETVSYKELVAIGEKKGEKRGEKRGEKKGEKKVAIRMFQQGYKPEIIHKLTGVPFKDLQKLQ